jgi:hypothetical protein
MSKGPRVTRMVMFKHGVAYVERGGPAEGEFELSFKREEMNDVLKSLAAWVARGDARVGAVGFEAPEDPDAALLERKLLLAPGAALSGLLSSLRGRRVSVDDGAAAREGEVIGIEATPGGHGPDRHRLLLRTAAGIELVDLAAVRSLSPLEAPSRADLEFLVDRSRASTAGESRTVRIALEGRAEDLRVAYVIPAPVWRVSYRLALGEGEAPPEGADDPRLTLMAWGIVHNPADEDIDQVELTLTTGQPVSFVIDLYHPKRVERAVVEEQSRAAAPPTRFERSRAAPPPPPMAAAPMPAAAPAPAAFGYGPPQGGAGFGPPPQGAALAQSFAASAEGASLGVDRGELFEYRVKGSVSLKRGGSAMVPLVAAKIGARKERIWRDGSGPSPDLVLTFKNDSGVVLEEGPAVIYDEATYAGESMVPYSARGAEVKLAFAKDLAVRCRRASTYSTVIAGVRIGAHALVEEQRREEIHALSAESDHEGEVEVCFELPKIHGRTIHPGGAQPAEETASFRRFVAAVPPHGKAELVVREAWAEARHVRYDHLSAAQLEAWLSDRFLDRAAFEALRGVLAKWEEARQLGARRERAEREQQEAYAKQTKIAEQLAVLKDGGPEGALRLRYVKELEAEQDKVNSCEAEIRRLRDAAEAAQREAAEALERITRGRG